MVTKQRIEPSSDLGAEARNAAGDDSSSRNQALGAEHRRLAKLDYPDLLKLEPDKLYTAVVFRIGLVFDPNAFDVVNDPSDFSNRISRLISTIEDQTPVLQVLYLSITPGRPKEANQGSMEKVLGTFERIGSPDVVARRATAFMERIAEESGNPASKGRDASLDTQPITGLGEAIRE